MADDSTISGLSSLDPSLTTLPKKETRKNDEIGQDQFMQLLVAQLKNQDPLNPSDPQKFAVDLATFSQLGELVKINKSLEQTQDTNSYLSSYLGTEVTLGDNKVNIDGNDGGSIKVDLNQNVSNLKIELLRGDGSVQETVTTDALAQGEHSIALQDLTTAAGEYSIRVTGTDANTGQIVNPKAQVTGIVTGFIPGADPRLLLGNRQIKPSEISQVNIPGTYL